MQGYSTILPACRCNVLRKAFGERLKPIEADASVCKMIHRLNLRTSDKGLPKQLVSPSEVFQVQKIGGHEDMMAESQRRTSIDKIMTFPSADGLIAIGCAPIDFHPLIYSPTIYDA